MPGIYYGYHEQTFPNWSLGGKFAAIISCGLKKNSPVHMQLNVSGLHARDAQRDGDPFGRVQNPLDTKNIPKRSSDYYVGYYTVHNLK